MHAKLVCVIKFIMNHMESKFRATRFYARAFHIHAVRIMTTWNNRPKVSWVYLTSWNACLYTIVNSTNVTQHSSIRSIDIPWNVYTHKYYGYYPIYSGSIVPANETEWKSNNNYHYNHNNTTHTHTTNSIHGYALWLEPSS